MSRNDDSQRLRKIPRKDTPPTGEPIGNTEGLSNNNPVDWSKIQEVTERLKQRGKLGT